MEVGSELQLFYHVTLVADSHNFQPRHMAFGQMMFVLKQI